MPSIGYGSNRKSRNQMPDGFYKFVVNNVQVRINPPPLVLLFNINFSKLSVVNNYHGRKLVSYNTYLSWTTVYLYLHAV